MTFSIRILISEAGPDKKKVSAPSLSGPGRTEQAEIARSKKPNSRLFKLARLLKRFDHIAP
jgi:hypothetical protein